MGFFLHLDALAYKEMDKPRELADRVQEWQTDLYDRGTFPRIALTTGLPFILDTTPSRGVLIRAVTWEPSEECIVQGYRIDPDSNRLLTDPDGAIQSVSWHPDVYPPAELMEYATWHPYAQPSTPEGREIMKAGRLVAGIRAMQFVEDWIENNVPNARPRTEWVPSGFHPSGSVER